MITIRRNHLVFWTSRREGADVPRLTALKSSGVRVRAQVPSTRRSLSGGLLLKILVVGLDYREGERKDIYFVSYCIKMPVK